MYVTALLNPEPSCSLYTTGERFPRDSGDFFSRDDQDHISSLRQFLFPAYFDAIVRGESGWALMKIGMRLWKDPWPSGFICMDGVWS